MRWYRITSFVLAFSAVALAEVVPISSDWRFQLDRANAGLREKWQERHFDDSTWTIIDTGKSWTLQGHPGYAGDAWYRKRLDLPPQFQGKFLVFHSVNETATVYLNGERSFVQTRTGGPFRTGPLFRVRLPNTPALLIAVRVEGLTTSSARSGLAPSRESPAATPGIIGAVELSNEVLVRHKGYFLAPDALVSHQEWYSAMLEYRQRRRQELGDVDRIYEKDYAWTSRNFINYFFFAYDRRYYDRQKNRLDIDKLIDDGLERFGGFDSVLIWPTYPMIGVDEQNQFEMARDLPRGIQGLHEMIARAEQHGVKMILAFNPWDSMTHREPVNDADALAQLVKQVGAHGVLLDTMGCGPQPQFRQALDLQRPGTVIDTEVCESDSGVATVNNSWGQYYPSEGRFPNEPGVPIVKWTQPKHQVHYDGDIWHHSRTQMLQHAFLNATGMLVWDNLMGAYNPWTDRDRAALRRILPILRRYQPLLTSLDWIPFYPSAIDGVHMSRWGSSRYAVWTIVNWNDKPVTGKLIKVESHPTLKYFDLWNGREMPVHASAGAHWLVMDELEPNGFGAILMLEAEKVDKEFMDFLQRQRSQAVRRLAEYSDRWVPLDSPQRRVVPRSPPHHAPDFPAGMVYVPGTKLFAMRIEHHQNEVACYPDREEAPWEERQYFMYAHMHRRVVAHHRVIPEIKPFLIDQNLVTNAEFKEFLSTTHYRPSDSQNFLKDWDWSDPADPRFPATQGRHPVVWVDIDDARAYAVWRGKRLPTEEEWQYAAGGWEEMRYPWGYEWSSGKANDNGRATTPVGAFPEGASPFGVLDMSGNVWQWTESERQDNITRYVMLRGGSYWQVQGAGWNFDRFKDFHFSQGEISARPVQYHTKFFLLSPGMNRKATIGFRCVKDLE